MDGRHSPLTACCCLPDGVTQTALPTSRPSSLPTATPTPLPTALPTPAPTPLPTHEPTPAPTAEPTAPTAMYVRRRPFIHHCCWHSVPPSPPSIVRQTAAERLGQPEGMAAADTAACLPCLTGGPVCMLHVWLPPAAAAGPCWLIAGRRRSPCAPSGPRPSPRPPPPPCPPKCPHSSPPLPRPHVSSSSDDDDDMHGLASIQRL